MKDRFNSSRLVLAALFVACMTTTAAAQHSAQTNSIGMELRLIPAGHYVRGDTADRVAVFQKDHPAVYGQDADPAHPVRMTKPFYIGAREVTVAQFRRFVEATDYKTTAEREGVKAVGFKPVEHYSRVHMKQPFNRGESFTWKNPGFEQSENHPVVCVSWQDAQAFCKWLSEKEGVEYRLPTEAEWEYACRAGTKTAFFWGNAFRRTIHEKANVGNVELEKAHEDLARRQWFFDVETEPGDGHVYTAPVGSFPANVWGLHDMHGNVWEWCHDMYTDTAYSPYRSPGYPQPHKTAVDPVQLKPWNDFGDWRVIRGGSWYTSPVFARSDMRGYFDGPDAACYLGFRVVRAAPRALIEQAKADWDKEAAVVAKTLAIIGKWGNRGYLERVATFHSPPPPDVSQGLHRISTLTGVHCNRVNPEFLQHVSKVSALEHLQLWDVRALSDDDIAPIANLKNLESLILSGGGSKLTNACIDHLVWLPKLKHLQLTGAGITDEGLSRLKGLTQLETLELRETGAKGAILSALGEVPLKRLILPDLLDEYAARLANLTDLEDFTCYGPSLTDAGFAHFAGLTNLTRLGLGGARGISPSGFAPLKKLTRLESLDVRNTQAGDDAMALLANHHRLDQLSVGGENLTDAGVHHICAVVSIRGLTISAPKLTDDGLRDFWRMQRLNILRLESDGLKGSGFATLAEARAVNNLAVRSKSLTDEALDHISAMPSLHQLRIHGGSPALTDKGLLMLLDAAKLRYLEVHARGTQITEAAVAKLKQANPDLNVQVHR